MSTPKLLRRPSFWIIAVIVLALLAAGMLWCYKVRTAPERVFWNMIEQNLVTSAVTVSADSSGNGTQVHQVVQYSFGTPNLSRSVTTLERAGTKVKNESVGTPTTDYTRYLSIQTDEKTASGKPMDFANVVGVWAKSSQGQAGQLFAQASLGTGLPLASVALPMGNLQPDQRQALLAEMRNDKLFQVDFSKIKRETQNGRRQYVYDITMSPVAYAASLKRFAKSIGLHTYDELEPNSMSGQSAYKLRLTVDVRSHRLVVAQTEDGTIKQIYGGYDIPVDITLPTNPLTIEQLQERITQAQQ